MKAFIPISISTELFSSPRMIKGLELIPNAYTSYCYVIGDRLQMYNDASDLRKDEHDFFRRWSSQPNDLLTQRRKWIEKLHVRLDKNASADIRGLDDIIDADHCALMRNIYVLYNLNSDFRRDLDSTVEEAVLRRHFHRSLERAKALSLMYVIEEVALNMQVRRKYGLHDEYYLGPQLSLLLDLFKGKHRWFLDEIGYTRNYDINKARFFSWKDDTAGGAWRETRDWPPL